VAELAVAACRGCGLELSPAFLACPRCNRLVHTQTLQRLSEEAGEAQTRGDAAGALQRWTAALELLPAGTRQHVAITERIAALQVQAQAGPAPEAKAPPSWAKRAGPLGVLALLVWKLKVVLIAVLGHAKLLLLGATKLGTLLTLLASLGVYWAAWGWKFAAGIMLSLYIHEMGHVIALRGEGIPASSPMFIPGVGAFVRLHAAPQDAHADARTGLAGPLYGLGAAAAFAVLGIGLQAPMLSAIAEWGARVNLFNLFPVWQLDGARGLHPLSRFQRLLVGGALAAAGLLSSERFLLLAGAIAIFRAFSRETPAEGDRRALTCFLGLILTLTAIAALTAPLAAGAPLR
jgi:Zn-dependent protease